ncbi:MAG: RNA 2'-phosphotransferase [Duganella sp.]
MSKHIEQTSKFLSLVLRHSPETIGLTLDNEGWANIEELISFANAQGRALTRALLIEVVSSSDKQRFAINDNGTKIRANQGHSIPVELKLEPQVPPSHLFHGTATRFEASIRKDGLLRGTRQYVHLSSSTEVAATVGARHGKPLVLSVLAEQMHRDGIVFYISENGVWLTESVPVKYIEFEGA